ncbi:Plasmodium exported protein, unknown function [Plasmodium ovale]|uniref:Pv-fam-d protein n=2 Tax=Plasmodium ovale TaxID=36330 RepID=A0A1A8X6X0_PLAOA|nr:Plasmodium exported protein, unknown function [Plasmodium ovale curtisi]SBT01002.1 Plasmodium exported protein, unknown function [Plasmodium ovale curtisi]SBT83225.1 Plasmodium exported protein, unknown function [Plasmodium ovale]
MEERTNKLVSFFVNISVIVLLTWSSHYYDENDFGNTLGKKQVLKNDALDKRYGRLLCKEPDIRREDKKAHLKERVIKILKEDESNLGKMLNTLVHDVNFQKEFNALIRDENFEKQFNELIRDGDNEKKSKLSHSNSNLDLDAATPPNRDKLEVQSREEKYDEEHDNEEKHDEEHNSEEKYDKEHDSEENYDQEQYSEKKYAKEQSNNKKEKTKNHSKVKHDNGDKYRGSYFDEEIEDDYSATYFDEKVGSKYSKKGYNKNYEGSYGKKNYNDNYEDQYNQGIYSDTYDDQYNKGGYSGKYEDQYNQGDYSGKYEDQYNHRGDYNDNYEDPYNRRSHYNEKNERRYNRSDLKGHNEGQVEGELKLDHNVLKLIDELKNAESVEKTLEALKAYENSKIQSGVPQRAHEKLKLQQQQQQQHPKSHARARLPPSHHSQVQTELQRDMYNKLYRKENYTALSIIRRGLKKIDKLYEKQIFKLLTTDYKTDIKNGRMSKLRYYMQILISVSPIVASGILLCFFINPYNAAGLVISTILGAIAILYFLFKMWNCKRVNTGAGKFVVHKKYKEVKNVLKK